jgi:hypothetical protein
MIERFFQQVAGGTEPATRDKRRARLCRKPEMVMDGPPFPSGRAFVYTLDATESSVPFLTEESARAASADVKGVWRIRAFAEDRVDHSLVHFQTFGQDGSVDVMTPSATSHCATLNGIPEANGLFQYDVHGSIEDSRDEVDALQFRTAFQRLCDLSPRTGAVHDCLSRAQEVACQPLWRRRSREATLLGDWCVAARRGGEKVEDEFL